MRLVLIFLFSFFTFQLLAQQDKRIASSTDIYSEEGYLQMTISYDPSCQCRTYKEYYYDGKVSGKRTFKIEGKKEFIEGEDISYFPNGTIKEYKFWKNTLPFGRTYTNHENGKLAHEGFYEGQWKVGKWKYYDEEGKLQQELIFEKGKSMWNEKVGTKNLTKNNSKGDKNQNKSLNEIIIIKDTTLTGAQLFQSKCASCHAIKTDGIGPKLEAITYKRKRNWLFEMIKDGQTLVEIEDKQAKDLFIKWQGFKHPSFKRLTTRELNLIIDYLKSF